MELGLTAMRHAPPPPGAALRRMQTICAARIRRAGCDGSSIGEGLHESCSRLLFVSHGPGLHKYCTIRQAVGGWVASQQGRRAGFKGVADMQGHLLKERGANCVVVVLLLAWWCCDVSIPRLGIDEQHTHII